METPAKQLLDELLKGAGVPFSATRLIDTVRSQTSEHAWKKLQAELEAKEERVDEMRGAVRDVVERKFVSLEGQLDQVVDLLVRQLLAEHAKPSTKVGDVYNASASAPGAIAIGRSGDVHISNKGGNE